MLASIFIVFPADASIMELSNYTDTSTEPSNLTDTSTESSNLTDTSTESSNFSDIFTELRTLPDTYIYTESNNLVSFITPTIGAMTLICGFLFATTCICYHVMNRRKRALKKKKRVSEHMAITSDTWRSERTFGLLHTFKDVVV